MGADSGVLADAYEQIFDFEVIYFLVFDGL
jgi:hypothetical protein